MRFTVTLTSEAKLQLEEATDWYASGDHQVAERWHAGFESALKSLADNPRLCGLARESELVTSEIRELHYGSGKRKTHQAVFRVDEESARVQVIAIRHSAQDDLNPEDLTSD